MASDNKGWRMDMRGCHERHCFLTEAQYDLESKLELFMQLEKSFSVEKCTKWLNGHYPHLRDIVVGKSHVLGPAVNPVLPKSVTTLTDTRMKAT
jgi:hypothetical protein